jgi:hypothetical protein
MPRGQGNELVGSLEQEWIGADQKHPGAVLEDRREGRVEVVVARR